MERFDPTQPESTSSAGGVLSCSQWRLLLPDMLDGSLSPERVAAFESHQHACARCSETFEETSQGLGWLDFIRNGPEPPPGLAQKILDRTRRREHPQIVTATRAPLGALAFARPVVNVGRNVLGSPVLRTAAMAFFSLALTLNLMNVRMTQVRLSDLNPASLRISLSRQFYSTSARVARFWENLRFVSEMEARVRDILRPPEPQPSTPSGGPASQNDIRQNKTTGTVESAKLGPVIQMNMWPSTPLLKLPVHGPAETMAISVSSPVASDNNRQEGGVV